MMGRPSENRRQRRRPRSVIRPAAEGLEPRQLLTIFTVTTAADTGTGSLRDAIARSNNLPGADTINFAITPDGQTSILLESPLPKVVDRLTIDGTTQGGYDAAAPTPMIELDGTGAGANAGGLYFDTKAAGSTIKGLDVTAFGGNGIELHGDGYTILGNYIGVDLTGGIAKGNGAHRPRPAGQQPEHGRRLDRGRAERDLGQRLARHRL